MRGIDDPATLFEYVAGIDDPATLFEYVEQKVPFVLDNQGKQILPGVVTHAPTAEIIMRMHWWCVSLTEELPDLLTSDRPVVMSHGVADERCVVALPLSPGFAFFATRQDATFQRLLAHGYKQVIKGLNESLVTQAEKYVYAAHAQHLRFVENRLRVMRSSRTLQNPPAAGRPLE